MTETIAKFLTRILYREEDDVHRVERAVLIGVMVSVLVPLQALAQVTPAAGYVPPDDTPSLRVGMTLYPLFNLQTEPEVVDAAGNSVHRNAFDVGRAYINITGQLSHIVAFRITPDIVRESGLVSSAVTNDSLVFRIKYAYAQFNLDDWMARGSWVRLGIQQTPWVTSTKGFTATDSRARHSPSASRCRRR